MDNMRQQKFNSRVGLGGFLMGVIGCLILGAIVGVFFPWGFVIGIAIGTAHVAGNMKNAGRIE